MKRAQFEHVVRVEVLTARLSCMAGRVDGVKLEMSRALIQRHGRQASG